MIDQVRQEITAEAILETAKKTGLRLAAGLGGCIVGDCGCAAGVAVLIVRPSLCGIVAYLDFSAAEEILGIDIAHGLNLGFEFPDDRDPLDSEHGRCVAIGRAVRAAVDAEGAPT